MKGGILGAVRRTMEDAGRGILGAMNKTLVSKHAKVGVPVKIKVAYTFSKLIAPEGVLKEAARKFSIMARNAFYQTAYRRGTWNGRYSFINETTGIFGTGLFEDVYAYLKQVGYSIEVIDVREKPTRRFPTRWAGHTELREGQQELERLVIEGDVNIGIADMATGMGKTTAFIRLIHLLGVNTLVTAPTQELLYQTGKAIRTAIPNIKVGLLGASEFPDDDCNVVVATTQTLVSLYKKLGKDNFIEAFAQFDMLIGDEVHHLTTRDAATVTWEALMNIIAYYRFGFSATPFEKEGTVAEMYVRAAFGKRIIQKTAMDGVEEGVLVPFVVYLYALSYPEEYRERTYQSHEWQLAHEEMVCENVVRNEKILEVVEELVGDGLKAIVVAQRLPHNELLYEELKRRFKRNVYQIHGGVSKSIRKAAIEEFKNNRNGCVLVASSVANEGLDIPDINAVVVAHGGKSMFQTIQRIGRGLRISDGKKNLLVYDFDDSSLGTWFKRHSEERIEHYKRIGGDIRRIGSAADTSRRGRFARQNTKER